MNSEIDAYGRASKPTDFSKPDDRSSNVRIVVDDRQVGFLHQASMILTTHAAIHNGCFLLVGGSEIRQTTP